MTSRLREYVEGHLDVVPLIDVLKVLAVTGQTGRLDLRQGRARGTLELIDGRAVSAAVSPGHRHLAGVLMERGWLDFETLHRGLILQARQAPVRRIGEVLMELGAVTSSQLSAALAVHLRSVVREFVRWHWGVFRFQPGTISPTEFRGVLFDPPVLDELHRTPSLPPDASAASADRVAFLWSSSLLVQQGASIEFQRRGATLVRVAQLEDVPAQLLAVDDVAPVLLVDVDDAPAATATVDASLRRLRAQWPNVSVVLFGREWAAWCYALVADGVATRLLPRPPVAAEASLDVLRAFLAGLWDGDPPTVGSRA